MPGDDRKWREISQRVAKLGSVELHVGVVGEKASHLTADGKLTMGELAAIHEYGAPAAGIPQRSFIRFTLHNKAGEILSHQFAGSGDLLEGKVTMDQALNKLGKLVAEEIKNSITGRQIKQDLKPATIARKGHDTALIDSGQLLDAIGYEITRKG
jgi:hypothetical protein